MRGLWFLLLVLVFLIAAAPSVSSDGDELEQNRTLLKQWRIDQPDHYQQLQDDFSAFSKMNPEQRKLIRDLDKKLHDLDPTERERLWKAMVRYKGWLDKLSKEERKKVTGADTPTERLRIVREIRQKQWVARLPLKKREKLLELQQKPGNDYNDAVAKLQKEESALRLQWKKSLPPPPPFNLKPNTLKEFPPEVQKYVEEMKERLDDKERDALIKANMEGKWPGLVRLIFQLAKDHPVYPALSVAKGGEITKWDQLKPEIRDELKGQKPRLLRFETQWPKFAIEVTEEFKKKGKTLPPLGASHLEDFPKESREFIEKELDPLLNDFQRKNVKGMEGNWPEYPNRWLMLARTKGKIIPGMSLPGPIEIWKAAP
jgi:hypothetical protein